MGECREKQEPGEFSAAPGTEWAPYLAELLADYDSGSHGMQWKGLNRALEEGLYNLGSFKLLNMYFLLLKNNNSVTLFFLIPVAAGGGDHVK